MGLEYELQLMAETKEGLRVVSAENYLKKQYNLLPKCCTFDLGNLEIATPPRESYKEAVDAANHILTEKLVPALINDFKLEKFALFLPNPMCQLYYSEEPDYYTGYSQRIYKGIAVNIIRPVEGVSCLKHWNISLKHDCLEFAIIEKEIKFPSDVVSAEKAIKDWVYDYDSLIKKGYYVLLKDLRWKDLSRVHIKIPYHYAPLNGNPNLLPNFEDILIPQRGWHNLVCYYKDNTFVRVRDLI